VIRQAGYDGEYGAIRLFEDGELRRGKAVSLALALPEPAGPTSAGASTGASTRPRGRGKGGDGGAEERAPDGDAGEAGSDLDDGEPPGDQAGGDRSDAQASRARAESAGRTEVAGRAEIAALGDDPPGGAFLAALDPDQRRAAACTGGALLIIAGPGTGKTRTLTHRIAHLVADRGVAPESCLAITFTNRAAEEMRERLDALLPALGSRVLVQTFHGLALRMLREHRQRAGLHRGFRVATEAERIELLAAALDCTPRKARGVLARIARLERASPPAGAAPASPEDMPEQAPAPGLAVSSDAELSRARAVYRAALERAALLDFDELLARAVALLGEDDIRCAYSARFVHVSIDEYQDIDELQYRLVTLLASAPGEGHAAAAPGQPARSLCAIGDPDQAIYSFRGADVRFFLRFREDFAGAREVQLTRNYRSTATIVDAALQAIAPSSLVADRVLEAVSAGGPHPGAHADERGASTAPAAAPARISIIAAASERAEAETVVHTIERLVGGTSFFSLDSERVDHEGETDLSFADFAVLYRTAVQAAPLCEALARSGIPFQARSHARLADDPRVQALVERMRAILTGCPPAAAGSPEGSAAGSPEGSAAGSPEGSAAEIPDAREPPLARALREAAAGLSAVALAEAAETAETTGTRDDPDASPGAPQLEVLVDMLKPLATRCGDLEQFLTALAMDTEIDLWDPRADRVSLLTLHAAKGLEFRVVFLVGCEDGILPMSWRTPMTWGVRADAVAEAPGERLAARPEEPPAERPGASVPSPATSSEDEERRLFFVGMTRARERLYLLHARKRRWRGKPCELPLSPFVRIIEERLLSRQTSRAPNPTKRAPAPHEQLGLF
jgi:DNA helicase-2/ATP-dependent DNA helicase PcrA